MTNIRYDERSAPNIIPTMFSWIFAYKGSGPNSGPAMFPCAYKQVTVHLQRRMYRFNAQHECMCRRKSSAAWAHLFSHLKVWWRHFWVATYIDRKCYLQIIGALQIAIPWNHPVSLQVISHLSQLSKLSLNNYGYFCWNMALMCGPFFCQIPHPVWYKLLSFGQWWPQGLLAQYNQLFLHQ